MVNNIFMGQISSIQQPMITHKLDLIDRRILIELAHNGRTSHSAIARKLNFGRETVTYRLRRMKDTGFLHGCLTLFDTRRLGFRNYVVYIKYSGVEDAQKILPDIFNKSEITRIKSLSGLFDLQLTISVRSPEELVTIMDELTEKHHRVIQTYELMEILEEDFLGFSLLDESAGNVPFEVKLKYNPFPSPTIDAKDIEVIEILKLQGDLPLLEISRQIKLAPIAVRNRIRRLETTGVIKKYIPIASLDQIGYQWWKVLIKGNALSPLHFKTYLQMHPNILWYMRLLGRWDYQISIFAKNHIQFHQTLADIRSNFSNKILHYDPLIVFNQVKFVQRVH